MNPRHPKPASKFAKNVERLPKNIAGTVLGHPDGHGFVVCDQAQNDIFLPINEMRAVLHGDHVLVDVVGVDKKNRFEGRITQILERKQTQIVGHLNHQQGLWVVTPDDKRYTQDIALQSSETPSKKLSAPTAPPSKKQTKSKIKSLNTTELRNGLVVVVELLGGPVLYKAPVGQLVEILGEMGDAGMEIEIAVRKFSMPHVFSPQCLKESQRLPDSVKEKDKKGRIDLTDVAFVTIDGEDARDFDDAVYCEPIKMGRKKGWRLLVAIADVSHYVHNDSAIDIDAFDRATSVYFPRRVIPMLPEKLSNGLCSLNPHVDRLCMVCDMVISVEGEILAYQFFEALMHSHARFTYTQVADILQNTRGSTAQEYTQLVPSLLNLYGVYQALLMQRQARGAIDLETTETQIICDDNGRIEKIIARTRNDAHRLIEEAMLAANVCSANFILTNRSMGLYRVHEGPTPERQELLRAYLKVLGISASLPLEPAPRDFQAISVLTKDRPDAQQIHTMLLRSMQQAIYSPLNSGHFGLAYNAYTHFTSPIRRYPDLLVHRTIKAILKGNVYTLPHLPAPNTFGEQWIKKYQSKPTVASDSMAQQEDLRFIRQHPHLPQWQAAGLHCSANERRADEASRDVQAWLKCQYMQAHLGEVFAGTISAIAPFGIFVVLTDIYIEGLVHITELGSDYFKYDESRQELRGERSGIRYTLGQNVRIIVSRVDVDTRRIDFLLVKEDAASGLSQSQTKYAQKSTGKTQTPLGTSSRRAQRRTSETNPATPPTLKSGKRSNRKPNTSTPKKNTKHRKRP